MNNATELMSKLGKVLNGTNDIYFGYTKENNNQMIIEDNNKRYIVTFKEIKQPNENMYDDILTYL